MRKLAAIFIIAAVMAACNDNSTIEEPEDDSTRLPNTLSPADTSTFPVDTSRRVADSTMKK